MVFVTLPLIVSFVFCCSYLSLEPRLMYLNELFIRHKVLFAIFAWIRETVSFKNGVPSFYDDLSIDLVKLFVETYQKIIDTSMSINFFRITSAVVVETCQTIIDTIYLNKFLQNYICSAIHLEYRIIVKFLPKCLQGIDIFT